MSDIGARYRNHAHYVQEGWHEQPKQYFREVIDRILRAELPASLSLLDLGCATGDFLALVGQAFPGARLVGADVTEDLLAPARADLPRVEFVTASALDLPDELSASFDVVTALGLVGIFDPTEIDHFFAGALRCLRPGGRLYVFSPFNEHGVDILVRHRKRVAGEVGRWELGWNVYAFETVSEVLDQHGAVHAFHPFRLHMPLAPKEDPVRTWTTSVEGDPRRLRNGLKLLVDLYLLEVWFPSSRHP